MVVLQWLWAALWLAQDMAIFADSGLCRARSCTLMPLKAGGGGGGAVTTRIPRLQDVPSDFSEPDLLYGSLRFRWFSI